MTGRTVALKYELAERVSEGPFFVYHAARDRLTGRNVGVRIVRAPFDANPTFLAKVRGCVADLDFESDTLERLFAFEEDGDESFVVGDLPQGSLLSERIRVFAPFSVPLALGIAIGVCEGLRTLHAMGVVHGDVGPHNVVATHGGGARLQLGGFWRAYRGDRAAAYAALDQMAPYIAPELVEGAEPSAQSDFYALGALLFELLTKRTPFRGDTAVATASRHATSAIPSARGLNPSVPAAIDALIARLLDKRPERRPADAEGLLAELNGLQDQLRFGKQAKVKTPTPEPPAKPAGRRAKEPKPGQVAPDMGALNDEPERRRRPERDVPATLVWTIVILFGTTLGLVVAWVILSFQKPREFDTPDLKGLSVAEATQIVERSRLKLRISERVPDEFVESDHIIATRPAPKDKIRQDGTIFARVSLGKEQVKVPSLSGLTVDQARGALRALNLDIDGTPIREINSNATAGAIVRQNPPKDKRVRRFSKVRVWIAAPADAPPNSLPGETPNGPAAAVYKLNVRLTDATERVNVRIDLEDEKGVRTIYEGEHEPNDTIVRNEVGYGAGVTFRIYYDGDLRKEIAQSPGKTPVKP